MRKFIFLTDLIYNIAFKKKQLSKSYRLWLNVPKKYITLSVTAWSQIHFFQIDRGKAAQISHGF